MKEYIITIMIGAIQIILSMNLIVRQKNGIAIVSEIISSLILIFSLNNFSINLDTISWLYIELTIVEYVSVKIFLICFMLIARMQSFYAIKHLSQNKKKPKSLKLKLIRRFHKAQYWPKLKLGIPSMADRKHPKTNVRFDSKGFPKFKAYYTIKLRRKYFRETREQHFYMANKMLYKNICSNSRLKSKFTRTEINEFSQGETPNKYVWHHHQDAGVLQLVDSKIHSKTFHIGGYSIWGGK